MAQRIEQLDSLTGLAALTVVIYHFTMAFVQQPQPSYTGWSLLYWSPLHCVIAGSQVVILFFVLSGFVLSIPVYRRPVAYSPWIIKRFCRIYMPYYGALFLAILLITLCRPQPIPSLTSWFNGTFQRPVTSSVIAQHLTLVDSFRNGQLNPVV